MQSCLLLEKLKGHGGVCRRGVGVGVLVAGGGGNG